MSRGRVKGTLRKLSRESPTSTESNEALYYLKSAPEIASAILGAALAEHHLAEILIERFKRNDPQTIDLLYERDGPLGSLSSTVTLAYALGVIDKTNMEHFNIVRHIRNAFAHARKLIKFDNELVVAELRKIKVPPKSKGHQYSILKDARACAERNPRMAYCFLCMSLMGVVMQKQIRTATKGARYYERRLEKFRQMRAQLAQMGELGAFLAQLPGDQLKAAIKHLRASQRSRSGDPTN